jgi:transcriptional regulator with XRE-family HTH domain
MKATQTNTIKQTMRNARIKAGLTQAEMSVLMRTTRTTITRIESGIGQPTIATLEKWAEVTGRRLVVRLI